jgi:hypothetical protein
MGHPRWQCLFLRQRSCSKAESMLQPLMESHSAWVATVSHFLELDVDLEVLGSGRSAELTEDKAEAL